MGRGKHVAGDDTMYTEAENFATISIFRTLRTAAVQAGVAPGSSAKIKPLPYMK